MKNSNLSSYEITANAFKVLDVANPIYMYVGPNENSQDVHIRLSEPTIELFNLIENDADQERIIEQNMKDIENICLIKDDEHTYGYIDYFTEYFDEKTTIEIAKPIRPDQIVPASMALLNLIPLAPH